MSDERQRGCRPMCFAEPGWRHTWDCPHNRVVQPDRCPTCRREF